jgi:hypothetical protein
MPTFYTVNPWPVGKNAAVADSFFVIARPFAADSCDVIGGYLHASGERRKPSRLARFHECDKEQEDP